MDTLSTLSAGRTFSSEERSQLVDMFLPWLREGKHMQGTMVDLLVQEKYPSLFKKLGSTVIRNKYRDTKRRFLKGYLK